MSHGVTCYSTEQGVAWSYLLQYRTKRDMELPATVLKKKRHKDRIVVNININTLSERLSRIDSIDECLPNLDMNAFL